MNAETKLLHAILYGFSDEEYVAIQAEKTRLNIEHQKLQALYDALEEFFTWEQYAKQGQHSVIGAVAVRLATKVLKELICYEEAEDCRR